MENYLYIYYWKKKLKININIIELLIDQSNLNFQDNKGNTPLHLICKKNLWNDYKNILIKKKLNIFILNMKIKDQ